MENNWKDIIGAASGDEAHVLGKFLYFSLANILVDRQELTVTDLCENILGVDYKGGSRLSVSDAFRSATGDIRERITVWHGSEQNICEVYCRDNKRAADKLSRELVKETLNLHTNQYRKLANLHYDKADQSFGYDDVTQEISAIERKICSSCINNAPTASRWRPSAKTICAIWKRQK